MGREEGPGGRETKERAVREGTDGGGKGEGGQVGEGDCLYFVLYINKHNSLTRCSEP